MRKVFEDDLILGMQKELKKQASNTQPDLMKAAECLHAAMEILEAHGLQSKADKILIILSKIAKKHALNDRHTKGLTSDKMIENLKHHGHALNLADDNFTDSNTENLEEEYQKWLNDTKKPLKLTHDDVDPELSGLLDVPSFDIDASDDDLFNMDLKEDSLEVFDKEVPLEDLQDFEDEK